MEQEKSFEALLEKHRIVVERYINFRMPNTFDADDVIGETYLAAYTGFVKLRNTELFKPWILSIAKNQCNLWFRKKYGSDIVSLDEIEDMTDTDIEAADTVSEILEFLPAESATLLSLSVQGYKQNEIAKLFDIPVGTVKSRLHYAKKQFRSMCTPEQIMMFEKGRKNMKKDYTRRFPSDMPNLVIKESSRPFIPVKCADESFIVPIVGNENAEASYRYPTKKLAIVSTCYVPKAATIHGVNGVKICRDTYNVKADKLYKNECIWFSQLTDEYIRDLGTIAGDSEDDYPTEIYTFLEENYDINVNGNDRVHGRPLLIEENPPRIFDGKIYIDEYNIRYTMGTYDITIGERTFETIKYIIVRNNYYVTENYVDTNGRLVMMRWYESDDSIEATDWYKDEFKKNTKNNPTILVNDIEYRLLEDRISEYTL